MGEESIASFSDMSMFTFCYAVLFGSMRASHIMLNALAGGVTGEAMILASPIRL
jgi:hypothetical protein